MSKVSSFEPNNTNELMKQHSHLATRDGTNGNKRVLICEKFKPNMTQRNLWKNNNYKPKCSEIPLDLFSTSPIKKRTDSLKLINSERKIDLKDKLTFNTKYQDGLIKRQNLIQNNIRENQINLVTMQISKKDDKEEQIKQDNTSILPFYSRNACSPSQPKVSKKDISKQLYKKINQNVKSTQFLDKQKQIRVGSLLKEKRKAMVTMLYPVICSQQSSEYSSNLKI